MDAAELLDNVDRFETEFELAALVDGIRRSFMVIPTDPRSSISESIVSRVSQAEAVIGVVVVVRNEFWTEA